MPRPDDQRTATAYLAIDLGAESGRGIVGRFDGDTLSLDEVHRFPNRPVTLPTGIEWDVLALYREVQATIAAGSAATGPDGLDSAGIDGWAVDYGLLGADGRLLGNPSHYRNDRFVPALERLHGVVGRDRLYRRTGIQSLPINTSVQLLADRDAAARRVADRLLLVPDLLRHWLTGETVAELTNASTTQLLGIDGAWDHDLAAAVGLDPAALPPVVGPGHRGTLSAAAAGAIGVSAGLPVIAVASHDTASAVAATPLAEPGAAYISSGTWSLVGVERPMPTTNDAAMAANLTNERGLGGTYRLLKNVMGLWLLQGLRQAWASSGERYEYGDLTEFARAAPPFGPVIDAGHPSLLGHGDMPGRIAALCEATGQAPPPDVGQAVRCVLESLALAYARAIDEIASATGERPGAIHVVGGGARNALLNQLTADVTGLPVHAGPVEATAIGNLLVQAMAAGRVADRHEIREVVRRSFPSERYDPAPDPSGRWAEAAARLRPGSSA